MTEESDRLESGDAAALLLAVLTLAATTINEKGFWELTDTAIAVVVGVIVIAYTHHSLLTPSRFQLFATGLTYASSLTVALAWFAQRYFTVAHWSDSSSETAADHATLVAAGLAALVTITAVSCYRCKVQRRNRNSANPKIVGHGGTRDFRPR